MKPANDVSPSLETKLAVLTQIVNTQVKVVEGVVEKQAAHHEHVKAIAKDINKTWLRMEGFTAQLTHISNEQEQVKQVIENNTAAFLELKELVMMVVTERKTTKDNIGMFTKMTAWAVGVISSIYAAIQAAIHWGK